MNTQGSGPVRSIFYRFGYKIMLPSTFEDGILLPSNPNATAILAVNLTWADAWKKWAALIWKAWCWIETDLNTTSRASSRPPFPLLRRDDGLVIRLVKNCLGTTTSLQVKTALWFRGWRIDQVGLFLPFHALILQRFVQSRTAIRRTLGCWKFPHWVWGKRYRAPCTSAPCLQAVISSSVGDFPSVPRSSKGEDRNEIFAVPVGND